MSERQVGPCDLWTSPAEMETCCSDAVASAPPGVVDVAVLFASQDLYRKSGHQYSGACPDVVEPCLGENCLPDGSVFLSGLSGVGHGFPSLPYRVNGVWRNLDVCGGSCFLPRVKLPGPVVSITEVIVNGEVLSPSAYNVTGNRWLARTDGERWPCGQDFAGEFTVSFVRGTTADIVARRMASIYACRLLGPLSCDEGFCVGGDLENVDVISQDGVTVNFGDIEDDLFSKLRTGIPIVDRWLSSVNPDGRTRRMKVGRADSRVRRTAKFTGSS